MPKAAKENFLEPETVLLGWFVQKRLNSANVVRWWCNVQLSQNTPQETKTLLTYLLKIVQSIA